MPKNSITVCKGWGSIPNRGKSWKEALFWKLGIRFCWERCGCSQRMAQRFTGWPKPELVCSSFLGTGEPRRVVEHMVVQRLSGCQCMCSVACSVHCAEGCRKVITKLGQGTGSLRDHTARCRLCLTDMFLPTLWIKGVAIGRHCGYSSSLLPKTSQFSVHRSIFSNHSLVSFR